MSGAAAPVREGDTLWRPSPGRVAAAQMTAYRHWLADTRGLVLADYPALHRWSVSEPEAFWASLYEYLDVRSPTPYSRVLDARRMPGARWFEGARVNYAEHALRTGRDERPALVALSEARPRMEVSWRELRARVAALAAALRALGIAPGDRVASTMPHLPETVIAFLACASIGAVWSSCSPDMGEGAVADRFRQIEPKLLFAVDGYRYGGRDLDRRATLSALLEALPTVRHLVLLPLLDTHADASAFRGGIAWPALIAAGGEAPPLAFEPVLFDHPLWIVYSSGTSGPPKAIVHGHGGIVIEHLKTIRLHMDMRPEDRFLWLTSTGWIVWNLQVAGLLAGATLVLFDGHPGHPGPETPWRIAAEERVTCFGGGAAFFNGCMKAGLKPGDSFDLSALAQIGSTGSPLTVENFAWIYGAVKGDVHLASISGGTDPAAGFVGGVPVLPVTAGEMQAPFLGMAVESCDDEGRPRFDTVGELVVSLPFPSMPLFFWNDPGGVRYRESYFEMFPGRWRHGDWIRLRGDGRSVIYGRSDSTINRFGVRLGTSEIYRAVEAVPEVADSMVVDLEYLGRESYMPLFVVLREGVAFDTALAARIKAAIRDRVSPRYVPDEVIAVPGIPRTLTGKKMEVPVRKLLLGRPVETVASRDAMANPETLAHFAALAGRIGPHPG